MIKSRGFTLIEMLIAIVIIAIAMTAAVRATTESIRATQHVKTVTVAHFVAMNILSQVQMGMITLTQDNPTQHGTAEMLGQQWRWSANGANKDRGTMQITVTVGSARQTNINTVTGFLSVQPPKTR